MANLMEKVTYKGKAVNFYEFEQIILDEYGDWVNVPKKSEANSARQAWMSKPKGGETYLAEKLRQKIKENHKPDPFAVKEICDIDLDQLNRALKEKEIKKVELAYALDKLPITFQKKKMDYQLAKCIQIALPNLDDTFISNKRLAQKQPCFRARVEVLKKIPKEDRETIFKTVTAYFNRISRQENNALELKKLEDMYGWKAEDIVEEVADFEEV